MGSRPKSPANRLMRRARRTAISQRRFCGALKTRRSGVTGRGSACSSVSEKLEALRNLIPAHNGEVKAEQLFQETADYILLLRTQVLLLQRLIHFHGSTDHHENQNVV